MENTKLNTIVDEINAFIKTKMSLLLNDLLVQSNEYEETKQQILGLPFVKQIIRDITEKQLTEMIESHDHTHEHFVQDQEKEEDVDLKSIAEDITHDIKHIFLKMNEDVKEEHIFLKIEETIQIKTEKVDCHEDISGDVEIIENPEPKTHTIIDVEHCDTDYDEGDEVDDESEEEEDNNHETKDVEDNKSDEEVEEDTNSEEKAEDNKSVEEDDECVEEDNESVSAAEEEADDDESATSVAAAEEEEEEEGVFEIEISGKSYFTDNEKSGTIYQIDESGEPGDEIGIFKNGKPIFH